MRRSGVWILCGLVLGLWAALPAFAQGDELAEESEAPPKQYHPPPAWKSVEIANYYLRTKKYRAALSRFKEAVQTDPDYAPSYRGLGQVYEKLGFRQKALEAYRKYLDALPSAKEAEQATEVHQSIARLEQRVKRR